MPSWTRKGAPILERASWLKMFRGGGTSEPPRIALPLDTEGAGMDGVVACCSDRVDSRVLPSFGCFCSFLLRFLSSMQFNMPCQRL